MGRTGRFLHWYQEIFYFVRKLPTSKLCELLVLIDAKFLCLAGDDRTEIEFACRVYHRNICKRIKQEVLITCDTNVCVLVQCCVINGKRSLVEEC
jgi:hypothetical protein